jgi:PTS system mannose-specific IIA component
MADLFGGTPSNLATKIALRKENVETVTGVNLPMIIQFVTERETQTLDELVESCIETAQDGIKCPTKIMKERTVLHPGCVISPAVIYLDFFYIDILGR